MNRLLNGLRGRGVGLAVAAVAFLAFAAGSPARAEWEPNTRMTQAVGRVMGAVRGISDSSEFGYDGGISVLAAFILPSKSVAITRTLTRGEEYILLGGGDDLVNDLDIHVTDVDSDEEIAKDTKIDAAPLVRFTAPRSGKYNLKLTLYKAKRGCFACMVILRKGGFDVPKDNLIKASSRLLDMCSAVNDKVSDEVRFHDHENQWSIYGGVFQKGEDLSITNLSLGRGKRVILAAGDDNTKDIDLFLMNKAGQELVKDDDADPRPVMQYYSSDRETYGLKIKNAAGGRSLILATVLDLR